MAPLWTAYMVVCKNSWWWNMMYQMGGPCYVAQKDGPNYSKQAFFRFFCSPAAMQCWEPIWKFLRCSGRLKQQLRSQPYLTKFLHLWSFKYGPKFWKENEIGGNNRFKLAKIPKRQRTMEQVYFFQSRITCIQLTNCFSTYYNSSDQLFYNDCFCFVTCKK